MPCASGTQGKKKGRGGGIADKDKSAIECEIFYFILNKKTTLLLLCSFTARSLKRLPAHHSPPIYPTTCRGRRGEGEWCRQLRSYQAKNLGPLWGASQTFAARAITRVPVLSRSLAHGFPYMYITSMCVCVCMCGWFPCGYRQSLFYSVFPLILVSSALRITSFNHLIREIRKERVLGVISCRFPIPSTLPATMWMVVASTSLVAVKVIFGCEAGRGKPY